MHYTDGDRVFESSDYRWGYAAITTVNSLSGSDNFRELTKQQMEKNNYNRNSLQELLKLYRRDILETIHSKD